MSGLMPAPTMRVHDPSGVATHGFALWSAGHSRFRSARVVTALLVPCLRPIPRLSPYANRTPRHLRPAARDRPPVRTGLTHRARAGDVPVSFLRAGRGAMLSAQSGGAEVMPKHPFTGVSNEARQAHADRGAAKLAPILKELQAAGVTSLRGIAVAARQPVLSIEGRIAATVGVAASGRAV
jgi:hypothetical protein